MTEVRFLPPAAKYIQKIKDKKLKELFREAIDRIRENPGIGKAKVGDLSGIYCYDVYYSRSRESPLRKGWDEREHLIPLVLGFPVERVSNLWYN